MANEEEFKEEQVEKQELGEEVNVDVDVDVDVDVEEYKRLAEESIERLRYLQADFDNYRKKFDKERETIIKLANENLIKELIIILDDFENSIRLTEDNENREGILLLKKKFFSLLQKH